MQQNEQGQVVFNFSLQSCGNITNSAEMTKVSWSEQGAIVGLIWRCSVRKLTVESHSQVDKYWCFGMGMRVNILHIKASVCVVFSKERVKTFLSEQI